VILIDANLLLYAYDSSSPRHDLARPWLERVLSKEEPVGLALTTLLAFVRISTHPAVFRRPLAPAQSIGIVTEWLAQPQVKLVHPTERHWTIMDDLTRVGQARGPLVMDAHLAALALEHGAVLCTTDRDFTRFPKLASMDPLAD
jgi:toxin-antitoxin system PIN domain toxin